MFFHRVPQTFSGGVKMHGLLDKILAEQKAKNSRVFHFCSYWGTWSRRLKEYNEGPVKGIIELNLTPRTPIKGQKDWKEQVIPIIFQVHFTAPSRQEQNEKELPLEVLERIKKHAGEELTNRLLTEDWLSLIDLQLLTLNSNGGCPLFKCMRTR